jgi:hypothetical protein
MADSFDPKELKKLAPEARLKKLKEIEESRKKEIVEADKLIKESIFELEEAVKSTPPPEDIGRGNNRAPEESELERQVARAERRENSDARPNVQYAINLYGELAEMQQTGTGYDQRNRAIDLYEKIKNQEHYISQDETMKHIAEGSRRIMRELFGEYRSNLDYRP